MEAELAESLEIVESFKKPGSNIKTDFNKFSKKNLKNNKKLKKNQEKQLKILKEKHGLSSKKYNLKVTKIEKIDKNKRLEKNIKILKSKDAPIKNLEKWCRLTGSEYLKAEVEKEAEEEETAFDEKFFEEFSADFLG